MLETDGNSKRMDRLSKYLKYEPEKNIKIISKRPQHMELSVKYFSCQKMKRQKYPIPKPTNRALQ